MKKIYQAIIPAAVRKHLRIREKLHTLLRGHLLGKRKANKYLKAGGLKKLQIGCGGKPLDGWLNSDLSEGDIKLDATKRFPFPDDSLDLIFCEQVIEHLTFERGYDCLKECFRVLKGGGILRLATPDMEKLCLLYKGECPGVELKDVMERHNKRNNSSLATACEFFNAFFRMWGHSFVYDEETLTSHLKRAGFTKISRKQYGCSDEEPLKGIEQFADTEWMKDACQIILEAQKT